MEKEWFRKFFDKYYYETYKVYEPEDRNKRESEFIVKALGLNKGSKILDIGCGNGLLTKDGMSVFTDLPKAFRVKDIIEIEVISNE